MERDWDYTSEYCDGCAELGMTTCSCEPDGFEEDPICGNCGQDMPFGDGDLCDECEEEQDRFDNPQDYDED
jgi:predicted amidophosphoribosyltransferase